ncbi:MAG: hypothetical protein ACRDE7_03670, partial [Sphingobacterium sp.]
MMKNNYPIIKFFSAFLIILFFGSFMLSCKKNDLDLDDPTVYKWEVTETWSSFLPNYDHGDIKVELGERKLVAKVEIMYLTNAEVDKLKKADKQNK